jgi:hypothetical protein
MTTLDDTQKQAVASWIQDGLSPSQIQTRLAEEFGLRLTFLDVKLLVGDLNLVPLDKEEEIPAQPAGEAPAEAAASLDEPEAPLPAAAGGVSLTVDQLTKPGAIVSGTVAFSDGTNATWYLDQMGRLGLGGTAPGYRPSQDDMKHFQIALERELAKLGY